MLDLYDTTLRDGTQREGISLSVNDKLRVAELIDSLGVHYIEGGWPGANPKDSEFFARVAEGELNLKHAALTAFGMTRRPKREAAGDPALLALLESRTPVVCLVGKSHDEHVTRAIGTELDENLAMVADSLRLLRGEGRRTFFDAEHFFEGYFANRAYALAVLDAAIDGGVECVVLCDTTGGMLPGQVSTVVADVVAHVGERSRVGVHTHNDAECAVANAMVGLSAGATHVQGTVNGVGERCGNANLLSVMGNLVLKVGRQVVTSDQLRRMSQVSHAVAEAMNLPPDGHQAYVGQAAFAHKAGLHASALAKDPDLYQHIEPERVGNSLRLLVSELAGKATIVLKGRDLGLDLSSDDAAVGRVLEQVKNLEHAGYTFEAADASFELLVRGETETRHEPFRLESFRTIVERRPNGEAVAEATVRAWVRSAADDGWERVMGVGEGNGPVDALDQAFRAAVLTRFPELAPVRLADYKVRIVETTDDQRAEPAVDGRTGTAATTRVLVSSSDGNREWETVGVSPNIIDASWHAISDAYTYALQPTDGEETVTRNVRS